MHKIIIVCEDLFGLEIYSIIEEINRRALRQGKEVPYALHGFVVLHENPFGDVSSPVKILGTLDDYRFSDEYAVIGIARPEIKKRVVEQLRARNVRFETVIAPWMLAIPANMEIGEGSIVAAYSAKDGLVIGEFVTVIAAMLSGRWIGDYSTVMRFSNIAGDAVGKCCYVGNHVYLREGKKIGDDCFVEDGGIVVKDVKSGTRVSGVPARKKTQETSR